MRRPCPQLAKPDAASPRIMVGPTDRNLPRRPATAFTTVVYGFREAGTILGCPGCWVARSRGGAYLGTFLSQRAARRAIERHLEAAG
jgi:hypothetical protein